MSVPEDPLSGRVSARGGGAADKPERGSRSGSFATGVFFMLIDLNLLAIIYIEHIEWRYSCLY